MCVFGVMRYVYRQNGGICVSSEWLDMCAVRVNEGLKRIKKNSWYQRSQLKGFCSSTYTYTARIMSLTKLFIVIFLLVGFHLSIDGDLWQFYTLKII